MDVIKMNNVAVIVLYCSNVAHVPKHPKGSAQRCLVLGK